jgi:sugar/nucleoside kinase (ribokinase family)
MDAGRMVALSLSDPLCVERHRDEFLELVAGRIDILFANEHEVCALLQVDDVWEAVASVQGRCPIAVVTRSDQGSLVITRDAVEEIPPVHVPRVVDTTGAGDLYAAGFLYGLTRDWSLRDCGLAGAAAAAEVISHFGARPEDDLTELVTVAIREEE